MGLVGVGGRQEAGLIPLPPHVRAVLSDQGLDVAEGVGVDEHLAGFPVIEDRDRQSPSALARDAPIAAIAHHRLNPILSAFRGPGHRLNGGQGLGPEALHRCEPLFRGPEDGRFFGAPVVGIAVGVALFG